MFILCVDRKTGETVFRGEHKSIKDALTVLEESSKGPLPSVEVFQLRGYVSSKDGHYSKITEYIDPALFAGLND